MYNIDAQVPIYYYGNAICNNVFFKQIILNALFIEHNIIQYYNQTLNIGEPAQPGKKEKKE